MTFSSLIFLFLFLPLTLLLYRFITSELGRLILMLVMSLLFAAWGSPTNLVLLLLSIVFNYGATLVMDDYLAEGNLLMGRVVFIFAVAVNLGVLCVFKYTSLALPIGISFYTFSAISALADVYQEKEDVPDNILIFALFILFFPKLSSGPIVSFHDFQEQLYKCQLRRFTLGPGINQFLMGLFKKVLIADVLGAGFAKISALGAMAAGTAWLGMILYSLQLYFDFSGYSDMAIGLSRVFGFRFAKNFDYPYLSESVSEFWRRWHISLGAWFRNYVYIPLGGNRCAPIIQARNLLAVWILTGIWHGSTLNFVVWGLYHGAFVLLEKFVTGDLLELLPSPVRILITDIIACLGWVFFFSPSLSAAMNYFGQMLGLSGLGFFDKTTGFMLRGYLPLVIIAVLLCGPLFNRLHDTFAYRRGGAFTYVSVGLYVYLFFLCIANLVGATYTTFLYAAF